MPPSTPPLCVDPTTLARTASGVRRLAGRAQDDRAGAQRFVGSLAQRLDPELHAAVREQWGTAEHGLTVVERNLADLAQALSVLADYFADLDRAAVGRHG